MDLSKFISLVITKKQTIASIVILFFAITAIFTFSQPLKYNSKSSVLIVQNFQPGTDPYVMSKSNEYISNILAKVVSSNIFYNDVLDAGFNIDKNYFSKASNINAEMKKWGRTVQARAISDKGMIDINVFHPDKQQLNQIAQAVNFILQSKHSQYHGLGSGIIIKIIDKPIISAWPAKPNIILNLLLAVLVGLIVSFYYVYLFPGASFNLRLWPKFSKRRVIKEEKIFDNQFISPDNPAADAGRAPATIMSGPGLVLDSEPARVQEGPELSSPDDINAEIRERKFSYYQEDNSLKIINNKDNETSEPEDKAFKPQGSIGNLIGN